MGTYNVHAGHCPQGKGAFGAVGILKESVEDRLVKDHLIGLLRSAGNTVYDCTDDTNCDQMTNLKRIVGKCNEHKVDYDISIHLNSGRGDYNGDGSTGGVEVFCYDNRTVELARKIANAIAEELGYTKRYDGTTSYAGVKIKQNLYVLRHTKSPAILIECCFVDDKDDANKWDAKRCANAIYKGITGKSPAITGEWKYTDGKCWYKHPDGSFTKSDWEKIDGYWFYFDEEGYMVSGWKYIGDKWYYFNEEHDGTFGAMKTGWVWVDGLCFYLDNSGALKTGWVKLDGNYFYLNEESDGTLGALATGWHIEGDTWYYLKSGGYMAHDELLEIGGELYYFMSDGHMARTNDRGVLV